MQKLYVGAVIAALCAAPGLARAEVQQPARSAAAAASKDAQSRPDPAGTRADDEASEYAAREKAAPQQLQEFKGGGSGIYIGTGALVAAAIIALLIVAL